MRERLISAAVLVPVVVIVFLAGDPLLSIGIAVLAAAAAYETARLLRQAGFAAEWWFAAAAAAIAVLGFRSQFGGFGFVGESVAIVLTFLTAVVIGSALVSLAKSPDRGVGSWLGTVTASVYASFLTFVIPIALFDSFMVGPLPSLFDPGRVWLLVLVLTVWSLDSFAFLAGRYFGRGRFFPHLSPNKTWSGAIAGSVAAVAVCSLLVVAVGQPLIAGLVLGSVIAVSAQAGDLTESMLKRAAGVKDSGSWIPGHGGVLDRVDSFVFAAPAMVLVLGWGQHVLLYRPG